MMWWVEAGVQTDGRCNNSSKHHTSRWHIYYWQVSVRASSTLLLQCVGYSVCVLSSVCVEVFDRDELTCIKLLWLYRKFRHVLLVVWVDPGLCPTLPWRRWLQRKFCRLQTLCGGRGEICIVFPTVWRDGTTE